MANCPCEEESATCIDALEPLTRALNGDDCVEIGLDYTDSDTIDHEVNGSGQLVSEVIVSPDANQAMEVRANGLFVQDFAITASDLVCGKCDNDDEPFPPPLSNHFDGCNGLEVRSCPPIGDCDGDSESLLWAPPPIEFISYGGQDSGPFKFAPLSSSPVIAAGTGPDAGSYTSSGTVVRSIPHTSAGGVETTGLTFPVENPWCSPAVFTLRTGISGGTAHIEENDTWQVNWIQRIFRIDGGGGPATVVSDHYKMDVDQGIGGVGNVGFIIPNARPITVRIDPGDTWHFRIEAVAWIHATGSSDLEILGSGDLLPSLWCQGELRTVHRYSSQNIGSLVP